MATGTTWQPVQPGNWYNMATGTSWQPVQPGNRYNLATGTTWQLVQPGNWHNSRWRLVMRHCRNRAGPCFNVIRIRSDRFERRRIANQLSGIMMFSMLFLFVPAFAVTAVSAAGAAAGAEQPQLQRFQRQLQLPPLLLMTMNDDVLDAVSTFLFLPLLLVLPLLCCKSSC